MTKTTDAMKTGVKTAAGTAADKPPAMRFALTNVKYFKSLSEETPCFTANFCVDGKRRADVRNDGRGGCTLVRFATREEEAAVEAFCRTLPDWDLGGGIKVKMDAGAVADKLFAEWQDEREEKRLAKIDAKEKARFAALGYPVAIRVEFEDGAAGWTAARTDADAPLAVETMAAKYSARHGGVKSHRLV